MSESTYKIVPEWPGYKVDESGNIMASRNGWKLSPSKASGYMMIKLTDFSSKRPGVPAIRKTQLIHRLVYQAHVGPIPPNMWINHKDGDKLNNHVSNLELTTPTQNHAHARDVLKRTWLAGDSHPNSKLCSTTRKAIRELKALGWSNNDLAKIFLVSTAAISKTCNKKTLDDPSVSV